VKIYTILCSDRETHLALQRYGIVHFLTNNKNKLKLKITQKEAVRVKTECGGTRTETRFGLSAKWTSPFLSAGVSVQSAAGSRSMCIGGSNAG